MLRIYEKTSILRNCVLVPFFFVTSGPFSALLWGKEELSPPFFFWVLALKGSLSSTPGSVVLKDLFAGTATLAIRASGILHRASFRQVRSFSLDL